MATICLMGHVLPVPASALPAPKILVFAKLALTIKTECSASSAEKIAFSAMQLFVGNAKAIHCFSRVEIVAVAA